MLHTGKKFWRVLILAGMLFLSYSQHPPLNAQTKSNAPVVSSNRTADFYTDPTLNRKSEPGYGFLLLRTIFVLALFFGASILIYRFLKNRQYRSPGVDGPISIVHDFPLNITKSLKIVRVANEYFLLGVSQDNVNLITRIEDKESIDLFKLESSRVVPAKGFFQDLLERYLPKGVGQSIKQSPLDITKNLKERLGKMKK